MRSAPAGGLIAVFFVASLLQGCLMVPVPWPHGTVRSGIMVPETATTSFRVGETSRAEVLAQLGPPARRFEHLRIDTYGWSDVSWYFPWMITSGGAVAGGMPEQWQRHILAIRYDAADRVERLGFRVCGLNETIGECTQVWADEGGPVVAVPSLEPHVVLNVRNSSPFADNVNVLVDGEFVAELRGGTWTGVRMRPGVRIIGLRLDPMSRVQSVMSRPCSPGGTPSFALRMQEGRPHEIEVGELLDNSGCPSLRWGLSRVADGAEARKSMREVW